MHVCFFVEGYPTERDPIMAFLRPLLAELVNEGIPCSVVAPQSVTRAWAHKVNLRPVYWQDKCGKGKHIDVYQPRYLSFSGKLGSVNQKGMLKAARRGYRKLKNVDLLYAHFWHMGVMASKVDSKKPLVVACGESKISVLDRYDESSVERMQEQLRGVIYVSSKSYQESCAMKLQRNSLPYIIAPNGYNPQEFSVRSKKKLRKELGWNEEDFVLSFVGAFSERKGSKRLSQALDRLHSQGKAVKSCFIGSGSETPDCDHRLFTGKLAHSELSKYLCASDVFVLPTTNEGCCNAIVEAMACGLPIISSDMSFNDDILDDLNSIRIDPMNVSALSEAIQRLVDDPGLAKSMGTASQQKAKELTIQCRAKRIAGFLWGVKNG